jgi:hypothetical protein
MHQHLRFASLRPVAAVSSTMIISEATAPKAAKARATWFPEKNHDATKRPATNRPATMRRTCFRLSGSKIYKVDSIKHLEGSAPAGRARVSYKQDIRPAVWTWLKHKRHGAWFYDGSVNLCGDGLHSLSDGSSRYGRERSG